MFLFAIVICGTILSIEYVVTSSTDLCVDKRNFQDSNKIGMGPHLMAFGCTRVGGTYDIHSFLLDVGNRHAHKSLRVLDTASVRPSNVKSILFFDGRVIFRWEASLDGFKHFDSHNSRGGQFTIYDPSVVSYDSVIHISGADKHVTDRMWFKLGNFMYACGGLLTRIHYDARVMNKCWKISRNPDITWIESGPRLLENRAMAQVLNLRGHMCAVGGIKQVSRYGTLNKHSLPQTECLSVDVDGQEKWEQTRTPLTVNRYNYQVLRNYFVCGKKLFGSYLRSSCSVLGSTEDEKHNLFELYEGAPKGSNLDTVHIEGFVNLSGSEFYTYNRRRKGHHTVRYTFVIKSFRGDDEVEIDTGSDHLEFWSPMEVKLCKTAGGNTNALLSSTSITTPGIGPILLVCLIGYYLNRP